MKLINKLLNIINKFKIKIDLKYIRIEIKCFSFFKVFKNYVQIFIYNFTNSIKFKHL